MKRSRSYRDLIVWQKSMDLVNKIYSITQSFPKEEMYGVTSQMRRAGISVPANKQKDRQETAKGNSASFLHSTRFISGIRNFDTDLSEFGIHSTEQCRRIIGQLKR